jgi:hypothetical protein
MFNDAYYGREREKWDDAYDALWRATEASRASGRAR